MKKLELAGIGIVVLFSLALAWFGLFEDSYYLLPAYDNALLHSGRVHYVYDTGLWIPKEMVFGGVTESYHVPAYASLTASLAKLTGLNWLWAIRLVALLFAILFPLGFYLLGKRLANWQAGVAAAFFALISITLITWGTRTSAISLGVLLVVYLLYFILEKQWIPVLLGSFVLAMTHPPSLLVFFGTAGLYSLFLALQKPINIENAKKFLLSLPFVAAMTGFLSYIAWHIKLTGDKCLLFNCLPQLGAKEFGGSIDFVQKATQPTYALGFLGLAWLLFSKKGPEEKALVAAWFIATLILVKNDLLGIGVFTERFLAFFEQALAIQAGLLIGLLFEKIGEK